MYAIDNLPRFFPGVSFLQVIAPVTPIISVILVEFLGFTSLHRMWTKRGVLLTTMKDRAYQHSLLYMSVGITLEFAVLTRVYLPTSWIDNVGQLLATPWLSFIPAMVTYTTVIRIIAGITFLAIGLTLFGRSVMTFGLDYLMYLFLYFPNESRVQQNAIYSVVRHPTYLSFIIICFGGALMWFSAYSFIFFAIVLIRWVYHIHFVEEKELVERFGESYQQYRQSVPAFVVRPRFLGQFFRFLWGKGSSSEN